MARQSRWCSALVAKIRNEVAADPRYKEVSSYRLCPATHDFPEEKRLYCGACNLSSCQDLAAKGIGDDGNPLQKRLRPECHAKTRDGKTCKAKVVPGKKRCRLHGGLSTGPRTEAGRQRIAEAQRKRHSRR